MKANRFFSVAYDIRHHPKIELLRYSCGGITAFGRWFAMLGILYDSDGCYIADTQAKRLYLCRELECTDEELTQFLNACAEYELISRELLEMGHIVSEGVCKEIEYRKQRQETGKKGGRPKKGQ